MKQQSLLSFVKTKFLIGLLVFGLVGMIISGCSGSGSSNEIESDLSLDEANQITLQSPSIAEPDPVMLPTPLTKTCTGKTVAIDSNTDSTRFENCTVTIRTPGTRITRTEFVNCSVFFESVSNVVFSDNIVRDFSVYEQAALNVYDSDNIVFRHNHIKDNTVGISVAESQNIEFRDNIFENNYQHNAIALYKSSGDISGNLFRYNFPHGILVHFIPEEGSTSILIQNNTFSMNVEDAINFEDWRDARDESVISGNLITKTNWAGILIEYNSWDANILIENNYVSQSGYPLGEFPESRLGRDEWNQGWQHGIKLEDCSGVTLRRNTVVDNNEHGVDIRNSRKIFLQSNTIAGNQVGIFSGEPLPSSYTRDISPLFEENAGRSIVVYENNTVYGNGEDLIED
jgi:parallel beta-helix repeat protein